MDRKIYNNIIQKQLETIPIENITSNYISIFNKLQNKIEFPPRIREML